MARSDRERWLQSLLNNVVYYLNEPPDYHQNQTDYALPDPQDAVCYFDLDSRLTTSLKVLLCWSEGRPVGFCTLKCRGQSVPGTGGLQRYSLDIIDSVFIRESHRGRGLATALIEHLIETYPRWRTMSVM